MPDVEVSARVRARLRELFERHREVDPARVDRFYDSERGYYPPEEAGEERDHFAICLASVDGELYCEGDYDRPFALQSGSKMFAYALALADNRPEDVLARVGVEPSGDAFNSIVFDERHHPPYNPMVTSVPAGSSPQPGVDPDEREQDDDADDGADDAAEVKDVAVADAEPNGEDQVAEQCASQAEEEREQPHELGPLSSLHMSGTSSRPTIPATSPVKSAPSIALQCVGS